MEFRPLSVHGAYEIALAPIKDARGYFMRSYDAKLFSAHGLPTEWVQENESYSAQAFTLRGLHMQAPPHTETKLVRAVAGAVWDVMVDLRRNSPSFLQWAAVTLSPERANAVLVPRGCAHGYLTLTPESTVLYKVDAAYVPAAEIVLHYAAPEIDVEWPVPEGARLTLSDKDRGAAGLSEALARLTQ